MSGITVMSPVGINQIAARPMARRLASLEGVAMGILNNSKPNSLRLQERLAELLGQHAAIAKIVTKQKFSAAVGAEDLDGYAQEVGAVITAIGD
jgi:hypothetical protein